MNTYSANFVPDATANAGYAQSSSSLRWGALHEAARMVAMLAGEHPENPVRSVRTFPVQMRDFEPWRKTLAEQGIADLAAIMEAGLAALLALKAEGRDSRAAAAALAHEFREARSALVALLPPN